MKALFTLLLMVSFLFSKSQSFEINHSHAAGMDTVNMTDANGKKQGFWVIRAKNKPGSCTYPEQVIEKGLYKDNKKTGEWIQIYCNGNTKSIIHFKNGVPDGPAKMYYENGKLHEEGNWKNNRWTGNYKSYDETDALTEIVFDEKGKEISRKSPSQKTVPSKKK